MYAYLWSYRDVHWKLADNKENFSSATVLETEQLDDCPYANEELITPAKQSVTVKAAIMMNVEEECSQLTGPS